MKRVLVFIVIIFFNINHKQEQVALKLIPNEKLELNKSITFKNNIIQIEVVGENHFQEITRIDPLNITHIPTASQDFNAILFTIYKLKISVKINYFT